MESQLSGYNDIWPLSLRDRKRQARDPQKMHEGDPYELSRIAERLDADQIRRDEHALSRAMEVAEVREALKTSLARSKEEKIRQKELRARLDSFL